MGLLEYMILAAVLIAVIAVIVTDNVIEGEQERYKCFLHKIYNNETTVSKGCKGIPDDRDCKRCIYRKNYIKKNKENK